MKAKTTLLAAVTCLTGIAAIALAFGKGIFDQNSFLDSFASVRAAATNRNITITYGNTYRGLYYKDGGNFYKDLNSVFFKMQDDQAYGYIHTSGSIDIKSEDNCIAAFWSNGSTCYFRVNSDYMYGTNHYTSNNDESIITMVEFRKPTQIVVVLDKGDGTDRCLNITCSESSSSSYVGLRTSDATGNWYANLFMALASEIRNTQGTSEYSIAWIRPFKNEAVQPDTSWTKLN